MEGMFFYAVVLVIMGVLGWVRRMQEGKADQQRLDEPNTSSEDLPEATRRQLYGESQQPIREARPAQRVSQSAPPPAIRTARPRQQQTPARRQPPPQKRAQQPARRQQTSSPPEQHAPKPTMQRMRSALEQMAESVQEQMDQIEGRPAAPPPPSRQRRAPRPEPVAAKQTEHKPDARHRRAKALVARAKRQREMEAAIARRPSKRLLGDPSEVRRAIILAEVLGTPKGFEF